MHHALLVRRLERLGDLQSEVEHLRLGERAARDARRQRRAGHVLHHQEVDPVLAIEVEGGADPGMAQARERERLEAKARAAVVVDRAFGEHLERDVALQMRIVRAVDDAHAALAELLEHAIARERAADHRAIPNESLGANVSRPR